MLRIFTGQAPGRRRRTKQAHDRLALQTICRPYADYNHLPQPMAFALARAGVELNAKPSMANVAHLTTRADGSLLLSYQRTAPAAERNEAIAILLARLALGTHGRRSGWGDHTLARKEWCRERRWAARLLIPDDVLYRAYREGWETWQVAEACDVPDRLVVVRHKEMMVNPSRGERELRSRVAYGI